MLPRIMRSLSRYQGAVSMHAFRRSKTRWLNLQSHIAHEIKAGSIRRGAILRIPRYIPTDYFHAHWRTIPFVASYHSFKSYLSPLDHIDRTDCPCRTRYWASRKRLYHPQSLLSTSWPDPNDLHPAIVLLVDILPVSLQRFLWVCHLN